MTRLLAIEGGWPTIVTEFHESFMIITGLVVRIVARRNLNLAL